MSLIVKYKVFLLSSLTRQTGLRKFHQLSTGIGLYVVTDMKTGVLCASFLLSSVTMFQKVIRHRN